MLRETPRNGCRGPRECRVNLRVCSRPRTSAASFVPSAERRRAPPARQTVLRRSELNQPPCRDDVAASVGDADEAARDFAATMGAQYEDLGLDSLVPPEAPAMCHDDDIRAMLQALDAHLPGRPRT